VPLTVLPETSTHSRTPTSQVFLVFSDHTYFELYSNAGAITSTSSLSPGGMPEVRKYMSETTKITVDACLDEHGQVIRAT
jgi:hypothetical protein